MNVLPTIQPNSSAVAFLVIIICVGVIAMIMMLGKYFNLWQAKHLTGFRFSRRKFKELATAAEFSTEEMQFLESYLSHTKIPRFLEIFYNYNFGQSVMRQIFRSTYTNPDDFNIEEARSHVFSMTQKLENHLHKSTFVNNTNKIPQGVRFYIDIEDEEQKGSEGRLIGKMAHNHRNNFEVRLFNGNPRRIPKGTKVQISLLKDGDKAIYSSKVKGYSSASRRKKLLIMEHGKNTQVFFGARRYNRKQLQTPAAIVPLEKSGDDFRSIGDMTNTLLCDISMTGCGVLSNLELPIHSFINVSYLNPYDNETIQFVCEIMGHSRLRNTEIKVLILQSRIVQIDAHDRNSISTFVYDFENEIDKVKNILEGQNSRMTTFDDKSVVVLKNRA